MNSNEEKYNYIIFHKNCFDGFAGFFLLTLTDKIDKNAIILADVPSSIYLPKNLNNKNVIIIDVAYKKNILDKIINVANKVTFIDHHISIREDVLSLSNKKLVIVYNEKKSGSSLVWEYFNKNKKMPQFIKYIEDNDIGAWKLKYTHEFITGLSVHYDTSLSQDNINKWNNLLKKDEIIRLIKKGKTYVEYKNYLTDQNLNKYSLKMFPSKKIYEKHKKLFKTYGQYKVLIYNGVGCPSVNNIALKILNQINCDFVIFWTLNMDKKEYILQFRSSKVDVGEIAKIFGGGGHTLASACSISAKTYNIFDLFY